MVKFEYFNNISDQQKIVCFSSSGGEFAPVPEFKNTFKELKLSCLYVIGINKDWYQNKDDQKLIVEEISKFDKNPILFGFSMGGYGAILFSNFVKNKKVVAISPQINLISSSNNSAYKILKDVNFTYPDLSVLENKSDISIITGDYFDKDQVKPLNITIFDDYNIHNIPLFWKEKKILTKKLKLYLGV